MIKKIIACADIHVRNLKRMDETYDMLNKFINKCQLYVEEGEYERDEVRIVVAGDIFENKISVSNEANLAVSWFLNSLSKVAKVIVICGNHDFLMNNKSRVDSLTPVIEIGGNADVIYLDSYTEYTSGMYVDDNIVWCLYSSFDDFNRPDIGWAKSEYGDDKTYVGLIHADINGAVSHTNRVTENGLDAGIFEGLDFVIAGHIHKHQEIKKNGVKAVYCGSLVQQNNGESVYGHGYVVWDVSKHSYELVELKNDDYGFYKFIIETETDIEEDKEVLINI